MRWSPIPANAHRKRDSGVTEPFSARMHISHSIKHIYFGSFPSVSFQTEFLEENAPKRASLNRLVRMNGKPIIILR